MDARSAEASELLHLATMWHEGWRYGHEAIVPRELLPFRTLEQFEQRMARRLAEVRVLGPVGAPLGFWMAKGDELEQFYVAGEARGKGVAATLMRDAEDELRARGVTAAWLACSVGNDRAARFYEKHGWRRVATQDYLAETPEGGWPLKVWRYEKVLT